MEWFAGLGTLGLLGLCCGVKLLAGLLAVRGRSAEVMPNQAESPIVQASEVGAETARGRSTPCR